MRVLLLTHVFPRAADDSLGAFLLHLTQAFAARAQTLVIAPHAAGLSDRENFGAVQVVRFHYAPDAQEMLAYTGVMHERVARGGAKILFARFGWNYFRAARRAAKEFQPDVIHAHWWLPGGLVGALLSKFTHTPLIITTHGTDVEQLRKARWTQPLARFVFSQARVVTCGSHYLRERLIELHVADAARVRVISMPVNPLFVNQNSKVEIEKLNLENATREFRILTVARLTKQKGVDTLLDALDILRARGIDARLRIAGDGDQREFLERKTRALRLDAHVDFLGARSQAELPALYAACDAFALSSVREGMGLVLAEALLCGAPVIATDSGGVTDIVRDGETGLLFPERDARALADALEKYARDSAYAARLARGGRALALERLAPERVAAQFLDSYEAATKS